MSSGFFEEQSRANHRCAIGKEQVPQLNLLQVRILADLQKNWTPHHWQLCAQDSEACGAGQCGCESKNDAEAADNGKAMCTVSCQMQWGDLTEE